MVTQNMLRSHGSYVFERPIRFCGVLMTIFFYWYWCGSDKLLILNCFLKLNICSGSDPPGFYQREPALDPVLSLIVLRSRNRSQQDVDPYQPQYWPTMKMFALYSALDKIFHFCCYYVTAWQYLSGFAAQGTQKQTKSYEIVDRECWCLGGSKPR